MGMMIVRHKVRDYGQWRPVFGMPKCKERRASPIHESIIPPTATRARSLSCSTQHLSR